MKIKLNYKDILNCLSKKTKRLINSSLNEDEEFSQALKKYIEFYEEDVRKSEDTKYIGINQYIQDVILKGAESMDTKENFKKNIQKTFDEVKLDQDYQITLEKLKKASKATDELVKDLIQKRENTNE